MPGLHVLFLARSLERGGAERQLVALAAGLRRSGWMVTVACFYGGGPFQGDLELAGIRVMDLRKGGRWDVFGFLWRLMRLFRQVKPNIVHGYLPVPNLLSLLAPVFQSGVRVVWGVRASNVDLTRYDWLARLSFRLECRLARFADLIIVNSQAGFDYHAAHGFPRETMRVIPNGIDTDQFRFDIDDRQRTRSTWAIPEHAVLVGLVGRLDPMKDHMTFIRAAAQLVRADAKWWFVCVGAGSREEGRKLREAAASSGLESRMVWVGACEDMAAAFSAMDIVASSSSFGEGFPNVIAEAMACGRPCVVTDVGDSARIVGDMGIVVAPSDVGALADGLARMSRLLQSAGIDIGEKLRDRVISYYSLNSLINTSIAFLGRLSGTGGSVEIREG